MIEIKNTQHAEYELIVKSGENAMEILLICDIKYVFFTDSVQFNFKL
jgi:hypothetical protein